MNIFSRYFIVSSVPILMFISSKSFKSSVLCISPASNIESGFVFLLREQMENGVVPCLAGSNFLHSFIETMRRAQTISSTVKIS